MIFFRKPVPTPHQVRGRHFRDHALILLRHKFVGCAKSRCEVWQRAQPRGAILRTLSAENRAVAHPTPRLLMRGAADQVAVFSFIESGLSSAHFASASARANQTPGWRWA